MKQADKRTLAVLVGHGDQTRRNEISEFLTEEGHTVHLAEDGGAVLRDVRELAPDVVILDADLPKINGYDVCKSVKTSRESNHIPIIMLGEKQSRSDVIEGLRVGANQHLTEPIELRRLADEAMKIVRQERSKRRQSTVRYTVNFQLASDFIYIRQLQQLTARLLDLTPLPETDIIEIEYSLNEALQNAIEHGSKFDKTKDVKVRYTLTDRELRIEIEDQGEGFDYENVPDPTLPEHILSPRGRGIYLIRRFMDEVRYLDGGRRVLMKRFLNPSDLD